MYLDIFVINIKQDTTKNFGWKNKKTNKKYIKKIWTIIMKILLIK